MDQKINNESEYGYVYCMSSVDESQGIVKIGRTQNLSTRKSKLELDGYHHFNLKLDYAIKIKEYKQVENLLREIFSYCQLGKTECHAVDKNIVINLMTRLDGIQVYPKESDVPKEEIQEETREKLLCPDGDYFIETKEGKATLKKEDGEFYLLKGSYISPINTPSFNETNPSSKSYHKTWKEIKENKVIDNALKDDIKVRSVSEAASVVYAASKNGWDTWKTESGKTISCFRKE